MRVVVDRELCESNGVCAGLVPEVFELGDDDRLRVSPEPLTASVLARVEHAVRRCPKQALSLAD